LPLNDSQASGEVRKNEARIVTENAQVPPRFLGATVASRRDFSGTAEGVLAALRNFTRRAGRRR